MTTHNGYPVDQPTKPNQATTQMDSQRDPAINFQQVIDMSNELAKVSKENANMRTAMVTRERELTKALIVKDYEFQKKEMELQGDYNLKENKLINSLAQGRLFSRFVIYIEFTVIVTLFISFILRRLY